MSIRFRKWMAIIRSSIFQHILFWILSFLILLNVFSITEYITRLDYIYTILFHIGLVIGVYINFFLLIPNFLKREKYVLYLILIAADILLSAEVISLTFNYLSDFLFPGYYIVLGYTFWDLARFQLIVIGLTTLLELSSAWFKLAESERKLMQIEQEKVFVELEALKSQINPHFLFNSLNNLYSLSLKKSDKAPEMILRLSSLMRYILYESSKEFVPLQKEIDCIVDYLEIQNLRTEEFGQAINFDITGEVKNKEIAPLIFLPLVENAFKHGVKGSVDNGFIKLILEMEEKKLTFSIINNKGKAIIIPGKHESGIGLENIRKRLNLIYPGKHKMEVADSESQFEVILNIHLY